MNITNPRVRYTAAEYLEAISKELLESNLNTIFVTLRNTEQYWRKSRSDLNYMMQYYGPATCVLVAKDLVSTWFFDNKFRAMLDFISFKDHPIGKVTHYFWRLSEYQGRGIQYFHLIWIKNASIFGESTIEEVSKFILQHINCNMPDQNISPLLYRRVNTRQQHNDYCLRFKKGTDVATSIAGRKQLKHKTKFYDLPRTDNEVNINDYNLVFLTAWEDNMDIKVIGEKSLLIKCELSNLDSKNNKNKSLAKCGALEAADILLSIPLYGTDQNTTIKWLDVIRYRKLKNCKEIEALDAQTTDIFYPSLIDNHYPHRPNKLENMVNHYRYDVNTQSENYFFSLLLMFQSWQKLDLRNECNTYAESFHKIKLHLKCLNDDLQKQQFSDDPENPIGVQYIEAGEAMQDFKYFADKIIREIDVSDNKMIAKLNMDQKRVFDRIINTVNSDDKSILMFIYCFNYPLNIPKYKQLSDHVLKILRADLKDVIIFVIDKPGFQNK
ncbi:hypothetical protein ACFW04_013914 [Cataglyphis niger]